jgi:chemotaxis protein methyltransferase CheR
MGNAMSMADTMVEPGQLSELLRMVCDRSGLDFGDHDRDAITRRVAGQLEAEGLSEVGALHARAAIEPACLDRLLWALSSRPAGMFGDPALAADLRVHVLGMLRTHPFVNVWHPACATGEEVYGTAILLSEEGLLERARIYGTDSNPTALARASQGSYPIATLRDADAGYRAAGGRASLDEYYVGDGPWAIMRPTLCRRIAFFEHNLATDASPNEFQLIISMATCAEHGPGLRTRTLDLFQASLCRFGFLAFGSADARVASPGPAFEPIAACDRVWRRRR